MTDQASILDQIAHVKAEVARQQQADQEKEAKAAAQAAKGRRVAWWRRKGPVPHPLVTLDGRTVQLRLTWARIDIVGTNGIRELFATATSGERGAMAATARLLDIFTGGEITEEEVMAAPIRLDVTVAKLYEEWLMAQYGPPMGRLQRWWAYLTNRPAALAFG